MVKTYRLNGCAKIGIGLSMIRHCSAFLTSISTKQVLQAIVLLHLDYCPVVWSCAAKKDIGKLHLVQIRAAHIALRLQAGGMSMTCMWISPGSKLRRDWLHYYWSLCKVFMCWMYRTVCSSKTCNQRSHHIPQVQNRGWEMHRIK